MTTGELALYFLDFPPETEVFTVFEGCFAQVSPKYIHPVKGWTLIDDDWREYRTEIDSDCLVIDAEQVLSEYDAEKLRPTIVAESEDDD